MGGGKLSNLFAKSGSKNKTNKEVKEIEKAAKNLLALKDRINTDKMHEPSFLLVVTAGEPAYRRDDGVFVAPIGCLRE